MKFYKFLLTVCVASFAFAGTVEDRGEPHLTPEKLLGSRFSKDTFGDIKIAVVGYCPPPSILEKYNPQDTTDQYFIHVPPVNVKICEIGGIKFLSLFHVYGGPVSAATMEELAYYGFEYVLAYGLAGGFGTKGLKMGDAFLIESAYPREGTTSVYTDRTIIPSSVELNTLIEKEALANPDIVQFTRVRSSATDTIYREYPDVIADMIDHGCDVVNCEASHLFAVCDVVGLKSTQCGVVTDVMGGEGENWDSDLSEMLSEKAPSGKNPLNGVNSIVELFVEKVIPKL